MNWIDLLLVLGVAAATAIGAQQRLTGLVVGVGGVVLFKPILVAAHAQPLFAIVLAVFAGLALGLAARLLAPGIRLTAPIDGVLGGVGGLLLGTTMALALVTSFPVGRDINNRVVYPDQTLPAALRTAVPQSRMIGLGRDILLYPLLETAGQVEPGRRAMLRGLHGFLIVGRPWERGSG